VEHVPRVLCVAYGCTHCDHMCCLPIHMHRVASHSAASLAMRLNLCNRRCVMQRVRVSSGTATRSKSSSWLWGATGGAPALGQTKPLHAVNCTFGYALPKGVRRWQHARASVVNLHLSQASCGPTLLAPTFHYYPRTCLCACALTCTACSSTSQQAHAAIPPNSDVRCIAALSF